MREPSELLQRPLQTARTQQQHRKTVLHGRKKKIEREKGKKERKRQKENETMNDSSLQLTDTICERKFRNFRKKNKDGSEMERRK